MNVPRQTAIPRGDDLFLLVVDDDPGVREVLQLALEDQGFHVDTAADAREAIACAVRRKPGLVITDLNLGGIDGAAVARAVRAMYEDTVPIVLISAYANAATVAQRIGAVAHLRKPFEIDALISAVWSGLRSTGQAEYPAEAATNPSRLARDRETEPPPGDPPWHAAP